MRLPHPDDHDKILASLRGALVDERPRDGHPRLQRVEENRARHHLVGVTLNAFARLGEGKELTGFEEKLVGPFRRMGFSDGQLAELGAVHAGAGKAAREAVFPEAIAGLTTERGYTEQDFRRDAPKMVVDILTQPNVKVVDLADPSVAAAPAGMREDALEAQPTAFSQAASAAGWSLTLHGRSSSSPAAERPGNGTDSGLFSLRADKLYCGQQGGDDHGTPEDEYYFGFVTTDRVRHTKYKSEVMEDMYTGTFRYFQGNTLWYGPVSDNGLVCTVDGWEQDDESGYEKYGGALDDILNALKDDLTDPSMWLELVQDILDGEIAKIIAEGIGIAIVVAIAAIIDACTSWMADDHLATTMAAFTPSALAGITGSYETRVEVDGRDHGEGMVYLFLSLDRLPQPLRTLTNAGSGKALGVKGGSVDGGASVEQWELNGKPEQQWTLQESDGHYVVWNAGSMRVLDVWQSGTEDGRNVDQWDYNKTPAQWWRLRHNDDSTYTLTNVNSGKVLDVEDGSHDNGANVRQWTSNGTPAQRWYINPDPDLPHPQAPYLRTFQGKDSVALGWGAKGGASDYTSMREWKLVDAGNGYFYLQNKYKTDAHDEACYLRTFQGNDHVALGGPAKGGASDYTSMREWNLIPTGLFSFLLQNKYKTDVGTEASYLRAFDGEDNVASGKSARGGASDDASKSEWLLTKLENGYFTLQNKYKAELG
ncbi:RICIN domain-containing protein [Streptomyces sp. GS7]|uniref:RICIN domain-containing protein n=1 Tax=Streptomyces sp. GS7 TaxID=2692234 RepID=UPI0013164358|nr:RICIN domain-containing protein [Streptomyces sp. GS7]QHC23465.1 hypothetical protein GR130_20835 [Streptomyces sp. GS7]